MDRYLQSPATLYIYGSAAFILLDELDRTSLDIDVAAPYCSGSFAGIRQAAEKAGFRINPDESTTDDHIEWVSAARLCLPRPDTEHEVTLWQGQRLTVKTVSPAQLVASKLIRYDEIDQSDVRYLCCQMRLKYADVATAVDTLPDAFRDDALVRENLANLERDLVLWGVAG